MSSPDNAQFSAQLNATTEAAIEWLVCLHSGQMSSSQQQALAQWLDADSSHRAAWQRLQAPLQQMLQPLRNQDEGNSSADARLGELLGHTLARAEAGTRRRRQILRGALGLCGVAAGSAWLFDRHMPLTQWSANLRTGTGERRVFTLPDGSTVTLDARSAVDLDFSAGQRRILLRQGALLAEAAPQTPGGTPFIVQTAHGQIRALGTSFSVRQNADDSLVGMLKHTTQITTTAGEQLILTEGHTARFNASNIWTDTRAPSSTAAWQRGMLEAHDLPLGEVVQALRAYRPGLIRIAPHAAALQVYGTYSLDDTDRALAALAETLPVRMHVYPGGVLVVIE